MDSLKKQMALLTALNEKRLLVPNAGRIELKPDKNGYWRLYFGLNTQPTREDYAAAEKLGEEHSTVINPFRKGTGLTAVTFIDADEK